MTEVTVNSDVVRVYRLDPAQRYIFCMDTEHLETIHRLCNMMARNGIQGCAMDIRTADLTVLPDLDKLEQDLIEAVQELFENPVQMVQTVIERYRKSLLMEAHDAGCIDSR